jgi:hypothetical protein
MAWFAVVILMTWPWPIFHMSFGRQVFYTPAPPPSPLLNRRSANSGRNYSGVITVLATASRILDRRTGFFLELAMTHRQMCFHARWQGEIYVIENTPCTKPDGWPTIVI